MTPITEFLIGLSWKIDDQSKRKMLDHITDVGMRISELALAFTAGAASRTHVFETIISSLDGLYWQAQRTNSTVGQIRALGDAAKNVGGQAAVMQQALEGFSASLRQLNNVPGGAMKVLRDAGVEHPEKNTDAQNMVALVKAMQDKGLSYPQISHILTTKHGFPEMAVYTATRPNYAEEVRKAEERQRRHGINPKDPNFGEKSAKLEESKNRFVQTIDTILYAVAERLAGPTGDKLDELTKKIDGHLPQIRDFLVGVGSALLHLADGFIELIEHREEWLPQLKEIADTFKRWAHNIGSVINNTIGWEGAIALLLVLLVGKRIGLAISAITALAAAFTAFLALFNIKPAQASIFGGGGTTPGSGVGGGGTGLASGGGGTDGGGGGDSGIYGDRLKGRAGGVFSRVRGMLNRVAGGADPGKGGGGRFNTAGAFQLMKQAGASDAEARTLAAIAMAESSGNPGALNPYGRDYSFGLWQINMLGRMGPERMRKFGLKSYADLYDPKTNARVALQMAREAHGYRDWSTYTKGTFRRYYGGESRAAPIGPGLGGPAATLSPPPVPVAPIDKEKAKALQGGSKYFDLHGFKTDVPPGVQNTWNNSIKNSSTTQHLKIDVHGATDAHGVAEQVTKAVTRAHDDMVRDATGTSSLPKGAKETRTGHAPPGAQSGAGDRKSGNNRTLPELVIEK